MLNGQFQIGEWFVEPQLNSITGHDKTIRVEPKVMQVLVCLAEHAGEVVAKERLIKSVWETAYVTDDVLTRCISELRKSSKMTRKCRAIFRPSPEAATD